MKKIIYLLLFTLSTYADQVTVVNDHKAAELLLGKHYFSLQWISWDHYGSVTITNEKNKFKISGRQDSKKNKDYIVIDGFIKEINTKNFVFKGTIKTQVSHINKGNEVIRSGDFNFRISGARKYWRMKEQLNPKDAVADYIDIYFKKYKNP